MDKNYIISIDMGGTKILSAAINSTEGIIARVKIATEKDAGAKAYVKALAKVVSETIKEAGIKDSQVKAVCLGIPGSVNPLTGRIGIAPNLGIKNFNMKDSLQKLIPFPVLIENDVNLGALGIKQFGVGKDAKDMLVVFVGTGIGAGLVFDGKLFRGATFTAGEIGHIQVDPKGPKCGCGKKGCFEALASRAAIVNGIIKDIKANKRTVLTKIVPKGKQIKSRALADAVKKKDALVMRHLSSACELIGTTLSNVTNLLNLDLIILGGGLIEAVDGFMIPKIKAAFDLNALPDSAKGCKIVATKLGDDAALFGGIALAEEFLNIKV